MTNTESKHAVETSIARGRLTIPKTVIFVVWGNPMPAQELQCTVISTTWITPTVFELSFKPHVPLSFRPGQFTSVVIPGAGPGGRDLRRAYSIASHPENTSIQLCVKLVEGGPGSTFLSRLKAGESFKAYAPYGDFVYKTPSSRHACFIATGTGIAPFRSMIQSRSLLDAPPRSVTCLFGAREDNELLYDELFSNTPIPVRWIPAISRPTPAWNRLKGRVTDALKLPDLNLNWTETDFYLCGNSAMIDEVKKFLMDQGVQKTSIFQEVYYKTSSES